MPLFPIKFYEKSTIPLKYTNSLIVFLWQTISNSNPIINTAVVIPQRLHNLSCLTD